MIEVCKIVQVMPETRVTMRDGRESRVCDVYVRPADADAAGGAWTTIVRVWESDIDRLATIEPNADPIRVQLTPGVKQSGVGMSYPCLKTRILF